MKNPHIFLLFTLIIFSVNSLSKNSFLVAPGIVSFDLEKPLTQTFILTNDGEDDIRLNIVPTYFSIDDPSLGLGKHIHDDTQEKEDITKNIRVSPKRLSLKPGQRRDIRVSIRPNKDMAPGSYRSHLLVQMLEVANVIKTGDVDQENGVGIEINVKMETAVAIYGTKGESAAKLEFSCQADVETGKIALNIINDSPWRYDGNIKIINKNQPSINILNMRLISLRDSEKMRVIESIFTSKDDYEISYSYFDTPDDITKTSCI